MNCPDCDGKTGVRQTRKWCGTVYRQRSCFECGLKFWTVEEDASPKEIKEMLAGLKMAQREQREKREKRK